MLRELRVENVGVIAELGLVLGPGMTVVTGETGAGKTLVVEAVELLLGARADAGLVRSGAGEARVEARFETDHEEALDGELVLARVVPADGRSRAYVNGRLVPAATLAEVGRSLVDLHGQHSHHTLLTPAAQRAALDRYTGAGALAAYRAARHAWREVEAELAGLGGDERERAREIDLLRFQVEEIDAAGVEDPDEDDRLAAEEELLGSARRVRETAEDAYRALEDGALDAVGTAAAASAGAVPLEAVAGRLRVLQEEVADTARELRRLAEAAEEDPARLEAVGARRRLLRDLRRKYGDTVADVVAFRHEAAERLAALSGVAERGEALEARRDAARRAARQAGEVLSEARRGAAPRLAAAVTAELRELAMPAAEFRVEVRPAPDGALSEDGLDEVEFLLAANPGEPARLLSRVASGGELARTMLAARVVLSEGPPTLVFDEVDAGIGGQAGVAVGRRLGLIARRHQVLCVTHLAQVAAFAESHVVVGKAERDGRTEASAHRVDGGERVGELSRMLSGRGTDRARRHAEELLASAGEADAR